LFDIFQKINHQFCGMFMDSHSRNLARKVVKGQFCMGPVQSVLPAIYICTAGNLLAKKLKAISE
jgi:hypothetical protein